MGIINSAKSTTMKHQVCIFVSWQDNMQNFKVADGQKLSEELWTEQNMNLFFRQIPGHRVKCYLLT